MKAGNGPFTLAIDIGGTFTDVVLLDRADGTLAVAKVLTRYPDPSESVLQGIRLLLDEKQIDPARIDRAIHGTTLVTNCLIERKGARTGLITTMGFRDALEIGREGRYDIYDLFLELPKSLVERRLRLEVQERMYASGKVMMPLNKMAVRKACERFQQEGVESVSISFLHAYANPSHEKEAMAVVREMLPDLPVSVSHEVASELREYERTTTTVANSYVQPLARRYLNRLEIGVRDLGISSPLHMMLSNGGSCSVETAVEFPVRLVESGPCGGALAAAYCGREAGRFDILAFDMGGTTAKAILTSNGEFPVTTESEVARVYRFKRGSGLPLLVPVLDMIEIGAGGGSLAHLNELGLPTVGPESSGSEPGPACYGRGGEAPTVTDADLVLGFLNPDYFLGGQMQLDPPAARKAIGHLGERMSMDVERTAAGIHRLVNENMANAARVHAAERGVDFRAYTLVATGGAGPVHACGVAERLGLRSVIIPPAAGVGSAFGLMLAPISFDFSRSYVSRLEELEFDRLNELFNEMEFAGQEVVASAGVQEKDVRVIRTSDMRYVGQGHEIRVPIPSGKLNDASVGEIQSAFDAVYEKLYGRICEGVPVQSVHWRVTVSGPEPMMGEVKVGNGKGGEEADKGTRLAVFNPDEGAVETAVLNRYGLAPGFASQGPLIVEEIESTTVVSPGWSVHVDQSGNLVLERKEDANAGKN